MTNNLPSESSDNRPSAVAVSLKPSGVPWLGDIPAGWGIERGKAILSPLKRPIRDEDEIVTCFRDGEVTLRKNRREDGFTVAEKEIGYQGVEKGDLVVHGMDGFAGSIGVSDSRGKASPVLIVLDSTEDKRYLMYYLRSLALCDVFVSLSTGIRERSCDLRWNKLGSIPYLLPPLPEQRAIADFLDERCAAIDAIVEEAKAGIEEYAKWKQSVVFEAVTKGLSPHAKMKDSGVEWIGEVPSDVDIIPLRFLIEGYKAGPFGSALITDNLLSTGTILVYTPEHIARRRVDLEKNLFLPECRLDEMSQFLVRPGDIIFPIVGSLGRAMLISPEMPTGIINQRLAKFQLRTERIDTEYFMWLFAKSGFFKQHIEVVSRGSIIVNLTKSIVGDMPVPIPSLPEQRAIAAYLDEKCSSIDALIEEKKNLIEDLGTYKKSLIYETVTGKRRVAG